MDYKNIYIFGDFDFSRKSAAVTRMIYYARALSNKKNKVYLLSCCLDKFGEDDFEEVHHNVFLLKQRAMARGLHEKWAFVRNLWKFAQGKDGKNSFLFYPSPTITLELLVLLYLKFLKKSPVFYELNEIRKYSSAFHQKISYSRPVYSIKKIVFILLFSLTEYLLPFYSGLVCISTAIQKYGSRYNSKTLLVPILTDTNFEIEKANTKYSKEGEFNVGFSGSIKPSKENLNSFIEIIGELNAAGNEIVFNLCGRVSEEDHDHLFNLLKKKYGLADRLFYYGNLNSKELSSFLSQQDLLAIPRGYTKQNHYGFSTKLSDYLNHRKPILVTDVSDNSIYIKDGVNGFIVPPDNPKKMKDKILSIIKMDSKTILKIAENGVFTSKNSFHYTLFTQPLKTFLFTKIKV